MHDNTIIVIHAARTLLSVPGLWAHRLPDGNGDDCEGAADASGNIVRPHDREAVRWTPLGAIWKAGRGLSLMARAEAYDVLTRVVGADFEDWSEADGRTLKEIIEAFDSARVAAQYQAGGRLPESGVGS